jgi:hypothetical protein
MLDNQNVFSLPFLGGAGEIEAPGNNGFPFNDHDLIVGNGVSSVNQSGDTGTDQEIRGGILFRTLAFI